MKSWRNCHELEDYSFCITVERPAGASRLTDKHVSLDAIELLPGPLLFLKPVVNEVCVCVLTFTSACSKSRVWMETRGNATNTNTVMARYYTLALYDCRYSDCEVKLIYATVCPVSHVNPGISQGLQHKSLFLTFSFPHPLIYCTSALWVIYLLFVD